MSGPLKLAVAPAEDEQRKRCIAMLEDALRDAKSGRGFDAVFIFATFPDSTTTRHMISCGFSTIQAVGILAHTQHELLASMHESVGVPPPRPEGLTE